MADSEFDYGAFAQQLITNLGTSAASAAGSMIGGMLMNSILQAAGFSTQSSELLAILDFEQQILQELSDLSSQIDLSSIHIEAFDSASTIESNFLTMQGYTPQTPATTITQFMSEITDPASGITVSLTKYQEAVMQGQAISVGPGQTVFDVVSKIIVDQYWGSVTLADMLSCWQSVLNQVFVVQAKGLSLLFNATYGQAVSSGNQTPWVPALAAVQTFVSGAPGYTSDLTDQLAAWQASVPDWLRVQQQGQATQFGAKAANKQYGSFVCWTGQQVPNTNPNLPKYYYVGTNATGSMLTFNSQAVDSTDFTVSTNFYNLCFANEVDPDVYFAQGQQQTWRLIPFMDENGVVATRFRSLDDNNNPVYLCIDHNTMEIDVTTDTESDDSLWFLPAD